MALAFLVIAVIVVVFALANRGEVSVSLWPLPFSIELRLSVAVLVALAVGILLGGAISWTASASRRLRHRSAPRESSPSPGAAAPDRRGGDQPQPSDTARLPAVADRH